MGLVIKGRFCKKCMWLHERAFHSNKLNNLIKQKTFILTSGFQIFLVAPAHWNHHDAWHSTVNRRAFEHNPIITTLPVMISMVTVVIWPLRESRTMIGAFIYCYDEREKEKKKNEINPQFRRWTWFHTEIVVFQTLKTGSSFLEVSHFNLLNKISMDIWISIKLHKNPFQSVWQLIRINANQSKLVWPCQVAGKMPSISWLKLVSRAVFIECMYNDFFFLSIFRIPLSVRHLVWRFAQSFVLKIHVKWILILRKADKS